MDESQSAKLSYIDSTKVAPADKTHHALMALGQVLKVNIHVPGGGGGDDISNKDPGS